LILLLKVAEKVAETNLVCRNSYTLWKRIEKYLRPEKKMRAGFGSRLEKFLRTRLTAGGKSKTPLSPSFPQIGLLI